MMLHLSSAPLTHVSAIFSQHESNIFLQKEIWDLFAQNEQQVDRELQEIELIEYFKNQ